MSVRLRLLSLLLLLFPGLLPAQGRLLSYEHLATITAHQFDSLVAATKTPRRLVSIRYDVDVYEVNYTTAWHDGTEIKASGFYFVPKGMTERMARLSYNHGSRLYKHREFQFKSEEAICAFFATDGYAVTMPDYVGLGQGERHHLYHHAETEALANVNLLRAVTAINEELGLDIGEQLFVTGYSQGGHAALATHQYMQHHLADEFQVTASAPMSGAYDLRKTQSEVMYRFYETPSYLPYLLYSMQEVYRILPEGESFFVPPYDTLLPSLFDGNTRLRDVGAYLPDTPAAIVRPELVSMLESQPDNALWKAMEANSPIAWAPEAPVLLCYCTGDEQVRHQNARVAKKSMESQGADHIRTLKAGGKKFRHGPCALYTNIYTKMWFDSFREGSVKGRRGSLWNRFLLRMGRMTYKRKHKK